MNVKSTVYKRIFADYYDLYNMYSIACINILTH